MMLRNEAKMASTITTQNKNSLPPQQPAAALQEVAFTPKAMRMPRLGEIKSPSHCLILNPLKLGVNIACLILNQSVSLYSLIREDPLRLPAELRGTNPST